MIGAGLWSCVTTDGLVRLGLVASSVFRSPLRRRAVWRFSLTPQAK